MWIFLVKWMFLHEYVAYCRNREMKTYLAHPNLFNLKSNVWKYIICWVSRRCWWDYGCPKCGLVQCLQDPSCLWFSLLFGRFSFIFKHGFVRASDKNIYMHGLLLRSVIAGENDEMLISFFKCMQLHRSRLPGGHHNWQLQSGSTDGKRAQFRCSFSVQHGIIVYQDDFTASYKGDAFF